MPKCGPGCSAEVGTSNRVGATQLPPNDAALSMLRSGEGEPKLVAGLADLLVVEAETRTRARDEEIVATAAECAGRVRVHRGS